MTGKTSTRLGAASSLIMNALKHVSGVDLELEVISDEAIEPISKLKTHFLGSKNPRLHTDETLMALSITSPRVRRPLASFRAWSSCAVAMPFLA